MTHAIAIILAIWLPTGAWGTLVWYWAWRLLRKMVGGSPWAAAGILALLEFVFLMMVVLTTGA